MQDEPDDKKKQKSSKDLNSKQNASSTVLVNKLAPQQSDSNTGQP